MDSGMTELCDGDIPLCADCFLRCDAMRCDAMRCDAMRCDFEGCAESLSVHFGWTRWYACGYITHNSFSTQDNEDRRCSDEVVMVMCGTSSRKYSG